LRFVLAIWVIVHHLTGRKQLLEAWTNTLPESCRNLVHHGYLAVGAFFVLSGFVLGRAYAGVEWNRATLVRYAWARVARVYPVYLLSLVLIAPFALYDLFTPGRVAASARPFLIANYSFVLQGWSRPPVNWNTPAWSLSCELFFYACFPLAALALARSSRVGVWIGALLALSAPFWRGSVGLSDSVKPLVHLADFVVGIAAAYLFAWMARPGSQWLGRGYRLYVPAAVFTGIMCMQPGWGIGGVDFNSVLRPAYAALLIGLALGGGPAFRALSARTSVFLGQASYSMYILHIPILWWLRRYGLGYLPGGVAAALYIASVVTASGAVYRWFEEPANRRIRAWVSARAVQR
jgi:peptidoglycan/LPS O-acetylase OafA/YrhL